MVFISIITISKSFFLFSASSQNTINFTGYVWEAPNITGSFSIWLATINDPTGAFTSSRTSNTDGGGGSTNANNQASFDASLTSTIYKDINTVQPSSNQVLIIIKT